MPGPRKTRAVFMVVALPRLLSQLTRVGLTDQEVVQDQVNIFIVNFFMIYLIIY